MPNQSGFQHSMMIDASMPVFPEEAYTEYDRRYDTLEFRKILEIKNLTVIELIERVNAFPECQRQWQTLLAKLVRAEMNREENDLYNDCF